MEQNYQEMQERLLPTQEKQEEMWEGIVKKSVESRRRKRKRAITAGLAGGAVAAMLACGLFLPQNGLADQVSHMIESMFVKETEFNKEVQHDIFSDEDEHVRIQIKEMLSDGSCVYLGIKYQALDQEGRDFLEDPKWLAWKNCTSDEPFFFYPAEEYWERCHGWTFNLEEQEERRTDDERYYVYHVFEDDDFFFFEDGEFAFLYATTETPGHLKDGKFTIKANLPRVLYRLKKKGTDLHENPPIYLSVSKLSYWILMPGTDSLKGENDATREADEEAKVVKVVCTTKDGLERYDISMIEKPGENSQMMKLVEDQQNQEDYRLLSGLFMEDNHKKLLASPNAALDDPAEITAIEIGGEQYELIREEQ